MNGTETQKPRSLWPYAIIGWFTLAITGIIIFITWAVQQRMDLVGADYYDQEIRHQQRIDSIQRTRALGDVRIIQNDATRSVTVQIPAAQAGAGPEGTIRFYRPSEAALDRELPLRVDATGAQQCDIATLRPGLWKVRVEWRAGGQDFYFDQSLVISGGRS